MYDETVHNQKENKGENKINGTPLVHLTSHGCYCFPEWNTRFISCIRGVQLRHIVKKTEYYTTGYSYLGSFNRIKRGSLVWYHDAVQTFKRHVEYEEGAGQAREPGGSYRQRAVPGLTGWH